MGADLSDEAVVVARRLADALGLDERATFVCGDVYDAGEHLEGREFDVVFTTWGVIGWLADLGRWAHVVAVTSGRAARSTSPRSTRTCSRWPTTPILARYASSTPTSSTAGHCASTSRGRMPTRAPANVSNVTYQLGMHGFAEIIDPLLRCGLRLDFLHEFPFTHGLPFGFLEPCDDGWLRVLGHHDEFPLSFALKMTKEG